MQALTSAPEAQDSNIASLTKTQNRTILVGALACACFSLLVSIVTLRWFLLMRRTFRHKLILLLIGSDTLKAVWCFIFPVVNITMETVQSESAFCQTSGFFLALVVEASDFAILIIALHSILYIFRPSANSAQGGLYPWRKYIFAGWLVLPLTFASLAFVNAPYGYTTAGTFCYLPKRPFWYRIALSWGPRYVILFIIVAMFAAVYIYVGVKFKSFASLGKLDSTTDSEPISRRSSIDNPDLVSNEIVPDVTQQPHVLRRPFFFSSDSKKDNHVVPGRVAAPWDNVSFITSRPLHMNATTETSVASEDFVSRHNPSGSSAATRVGGFLDMFPSPYNSARNSGTASICPTTATTNTVTSARTISSVKDALANKYGHKQLRTQHHPTQVSAQQPRKPKDPLDMTRTAIRRQLRYMFVYPVVYVLMWLIPFVSHCLLYSDWYSKRPIFWLQVVSSCCVALQAAADCIVFSWREKPWRRIPDDSKYTITYWRNSFILKYDHAAQRSIPSSMVAVQGHGASPLVSPRTKRLSRPNAMWWEAEGRKRNDSVWLGTDTNDALPSPVQPVRSHESALAAIMEVDQQQNIKTLREVKHTAAGGGNEPPIPT